MESDPDLRAVDELDTPMSRDGSFFSLTSGNSTANSVYATAQGSLADSVNSAGTGRSRTSGGGSQEDEDGEQGQGQNGMATVLLNPNGTGAEKTPQPPTLSPVQRCTLGVGPNPGMGSRGSSSSTLAESFLSTDEELAFLSPDMDDPRPPYSYNSLMEDRSGATSSEGLEISNDNENGDTFSVTAADPADASRLSEVKEDVSRICNALAETSNVEKQEYIERILDKMLSGDGDRESLKKLRNLALSDSGLLSNTLRKGAWPFLLGIPVEDIQAFETRKLPKKVEVVAEEIKNLVHMDVSRVLKRFPPGLSDPQQDHLLTYLTTLICSVLEKNPGAYYYQGFHDISLTFLLVCISQSAPYLAYMCLNRMVESSLAPFMEVTMDATHDLIHVVYSIIEQEDPALFNKIVKENKCPVAFCLPWVLTWFSHTLPNDSDVFRLYDFILGCMDEVNPPCLIPIFTSAALILRNSQQIRSAVKETDIASMHQALSLLPSQQDTLEPWLQDSLKLMKKYSYHEAELRQRAVKIKELQFELWTQDTNNNRGNRSRTSRNANNESRVAAVGRFVFVRHRWISVAIVVLGAAYLLQSKYDLSSSFQWSVVKKYIPQRFQALFSSFLNELEFETFENEK